MSERSFLFVPGNRPERFDKASASGADAVIIDLEDAVAPPDKDDARDAVAAWLAAGGTAWVRINGRETDWFARDLALLAAPGLRGVVLPKAERADDLAALAAHMRHGVPLMPLVETALGLWNAAALASAPGVTRLAFGSIDFQLDTGIGGDGDELLFARSQLVLVSRVAGCLPPVDGVTVELNDVAVLAADVERARRLGFGGKLAIHPKQVDGINAGFLPPAAEIQWAQRVVTAAAAAGDNAVRVDGKMIDRPVIERARAILKLAERA
jgi:citrate lyase subunit beta / citryl-CoA lyase